VALALVRREVGARAHQPELLFGGEAAPEADEGSCLGERVCAKEERQNQKHELQGIPLKRNRCRAFPSISTVLAPARPPCPGDSREARSRRPPRACGRS